MEFDENQYQGQPPPQGQQPQPQQPPQQGQAVAAGKVAPDPFEEAEPTPEEQAQYDDLVTRALMFISDTRHPADKKSVPEEKKKEAKKSLKAPRDAVIDAMNVKNLPVEEAIGYTASNVLWNITNNAKRQGTNYEGPVVMAAGEEVIGALYELGKAAKIWDGLPKSDSQEEQQLLGKAYMEGARYFGMRMKDTGQLEEHQGEALQEMKQQIDREAQEGGLDNIDPAQEMGPELVDLVQRAASGDQQAMQMLQQRGGQANGA